MKYSKGEEGEGYTAHVGVTEYFRCWQEGRGIEEEGQGEGQFLPLEKGGKSGRGGARGGGSEEYLRMT